jgi:hypothetical protein
MAAKQKHFFRKGDDPHSRFLPESALIIMLKTIQVLGAAALVFIPVGILWLAEPSKLQAFGVVVGSTTVFGVVVTSTNELNTHKTLGLVCAYMAIMVVFAAASSSSMPLDRRGR